MRGYSICKTFLTTSLKLKPNFFDFGHSKSAVEKNNHCKKSKQVHSKDQLQVQEQVNDTIC